VSPNLSGRRKILCGCEASSRKSVKPVCEKNFPGENKVYLSPKLKIGSNYLSKYGIFYS
jgi:hypothetical protein